MRHVDEGLLHAWLDGQLAALGPDLGEEVRGHLAACAECRARLEEARGIRERAEALLRSVDPVGVEIPPFEALAARGVPARRPRSGTALAWAASLVLAIGAGWLAHSALQQPPAPSGASRTLAEASRRPAAAPAAPAAPPADEAAVAVRGPESGPPPRARVATREETASAGAGRDATEEAEFIPPPAPPPAPVVAEPAVPSPAERPAASAPGAAPALAPPPPAPVAAGETSERRLRRAESPPPPPPARKTTGDSALALEELVVTGADAPSVPAGGVAPDAEGWFSIGSREARRLLGREPLRVRGLPVASIQAGRLGGREVVRVRQALGGGALLSLVQVRDRPGTASAPAAGDSLPEAQEDVSGEIARLVRRVGNVTVTASAPVPPDSLARLLERLR